MDSPPPRDRNRPGGIVGGRLVFALLMVVLLGWATGRVMQRAAPIGRNLRGDPAVQAILRDGADRAAALAAPTLRRAQEAMGLLI